MPDNGPLEEAERRAVARPALPRLQINDDVGVLPLRSLLQDFAEQNARGARVTVSHSDSASAAIGHGMVKYSAKANRYNITLNVAKLQEEGEYENVVAHEIAHLLDPDGFDCDGKHEDFADALGPLLLERAPATLEEAQPLVEQVTKALG